MEIPRHWRLKKQRYSLVGEVCAHCDKPMFPPRDVCPNCGDEAEEKFSKVAKDNVFQPREKAEVPVET